MRNRLLATIFLGATVLLFERQQEQHDVDEQRRWNQWRNEERMWREEDRMRDYWELHRRPPARLWEQGDEEDRDGR